MQANQHETAPADVAAARVGNGQRITHGNRRIDGVPSRAENIDADLRGIVLRRCDHRMLRGCSDPFGTRRNRGIR